MQRHGMQCKVIEGKLRQGMHAYMYVCNACMHACAYLSIYSIYLCAFVSAFASVSVSVSVSVSGGVSIDLSYLPYFILRVMSIISNWSAIYYMSCLSVYTVYDICLI